MIYSDEIFPRFLYFPAIACMLSPISLLPYKGAVYVFFIILFIAAEFSLILIDKILDYKEATNRNMRFLILLSMSNGFVIMYVFEILQMKYIAIFLLLLFLKRELDDQKDHTLSFFLLQITLLIFAVMMIPYLLLLIPLYLLHNVPLRNIFSKEQIKNYTYLGVIFLVSNFMIFVDPNLILYIFGTSIGFAGIRLYPFNLYNYPSTLTASVLIENNLHFSRDVITNVLILFRFYFGLSETILLSLEIISLSMGVLSILILIALTFKMNKKEVGIDQKFGYYALYILLVSVHYYFPFFVVAIPLIVIVLLDMNREYKKRLYVGLVCVFLLYFLPPTFQLLELWSFLSIIPIPIIILRQNILYLILFFLDRSKKTLQNNAHLNDLPIYMVKGN